MVADCLLIIIPSIVFFEKIESRLQSGAKCVMIGWILNLLGRVRVMNLERLKNNGIASVALGYIIWGLLPLYWHFLAGFSSIFVLCNRILWGLIFALLVLFLQKRLKVFFDVLKDRAAMKQLVLASVLVTLNWGLYIYAISSGHTLDASLGYYINPLMVFVISLLIFKEKGTAMQVVALGIIAIGIILTILRYGTFPILSMLLPITFTAYGAVKKCVSVDPIAGTAIECLIAVPFAILYALIFHMDTIHSLSGGQLVLLLITGPATAIPLILFSNGVNKAPYLSISMVMYISPTLTLLCGLLSGETLTPEKILPFIFTLAALVIYSADLIIRERKKKPAILSKETP